MRRFLISVSVFFILIIFSDPVYSGRIGFQIGTTVATPTAAKMYLKPWDKISTLNVSEGSNPIIDFSSGAFGSAAPGKTSWQDEDDWTAKAENVGFDLVCVGPPGSNNRLSVRCTELSDGAGHTIHHVDNYLVNGKSYSRKNFGVTVTKNYGQPKAVYNVLSTADTVIDTFTGTCARIYHFYNSLDIPAETVPGKEYSATYVITFI